MTAVQHESHRSLFAACVAAEPSPCFSPNPVTPARSVVIGSGAGYVDILHRTSNQTPISQSASKTFLQLLHVPTLAGLPSHLVSSFTPPPFVKPTYSAWALHSRCSSWDRCPLRAAPWSSGGEQAEGWTSPWVAGDARSMLER